MAKHTKVSRSTASKGQSITDSLLKVSANRRPRKSMKKIIVIGTGRMGGAFATAFVNRTSHAVSIRRAHAGSSSAAASAVRRFNCTETGKKSMNDAITPFTLAVPQADLEDLNRRIIDQTRWPDAETVDDGTQGAPLAKVKALVDHWRHRYEWRRCEAMLNNWSQYKTTIDGLDIHFLHVRSKHENALPLIITHGWPGSVIEFMKIRNSRPCTPR